MIIATQTLTPALVPIEIGLATVRKRRGPEGNRGLASGLLVTNPGEEWLPASEFISGRALDRLLTAAQQRWQASPHVAGSLLWRSYTYWLTLPVALGWATARRVLLVEPEDVLVRVHDTPDAPLLSIGLARLRMAVSTDDPLGGHHSPTLDTGFDPGDLLVFDSQQQLLEQLRQSLRTHHLDPLLAELHHRLRLGERTLLGSLASAVAYALVRGLDAPFGDLDHELRTLLTTLDVADLVSVVTGPDGPSVQRHTCCLAFTLPNPKICSSCCLRNPR